MNEVDALLGAWMARQRERRAISQEALALQLGRDQPAISKIEHGLRRISVAELLSWADALGVSDEDLALALGALRRRLGDIGWDE